MAPRAPSTSQCKAIFSSAKQLIAFLSILGGVFFFLSVQLLCSTSSIFPASLRHLGWRKWVCLDVGLRRSKDSQLREGGGTLGGLRASRQT